MVRVNIGADAVLTLCESENWVHMGMVAWIHRHPHLMQTPARGTQNEGRK